MISNSNATGEATEEKNNKCSQYNCVVPIDTKVVCGIRQFGPGFKVRLFLNECEMLKYNCEKNFVFEATDVYVCDGMPLPRPSTSNLVPRKLNLILDNTQGSNTNNMPYTDVIDNSQKKSIEDTNSVNHIIENILTTDADVRATPKVNEAIEINDEDEVEQTVGSETPSTNADEATQSTDVTVVDDPETMNYDDTPDTDMESLEKTTETVLTLESVTAVKTKSGKRRKNLIVVDATLFDVNGNINDTIDNFFAATHIFDLPLQKVRNE